MENITKRLKEKIAEMYEITARQQNRDSLLQEIRDDYEKPLRELENHDDKMKKYIEAVAKYNDNLNLLQLGNALAKIVSNIIGKEYIFVREVEYLGSFNERFKDCEGEQLLGAVLRIVDKEGKLIEEVDSDHEFIDFLVIDKEAYERGYWKSKWKKNKEFKFFDALGKENELAVIIQANGHLDFKDIKKNGYIVINTIVNTIDLHLYNFHIVHGWCTGYEIFYDRTTTLGLIINEFLRNLMFTRYINHKTELSDEEMDQIVDQFIQFAIANPTNLHQIIDIKLDSNPEKVGSSYVKKRV